MKSLLTRLTAAAGNDGGFSYGPGRSAAAEPTALAALTLAAHSTEPRLAAATLDWLAKHRKSDGAVAAAATPDAPCWTTALALLAWTRGAEDDRQRHAADAAQAATWLLQARGRPVRNEEGNLGHDTTLIGWSWADGTSSWVEPTAHAILALRAAGHAGQPRVREGVRLLLDRTIPNSGWNYGNPRVLGSTLRAFPDTTGVALAALAGEPRDARIAAALRYLADELPRVRAPFSLGWGLLGLRAWDARPAEADAWLAEAAAQSLETEPRPVHDALLLLAAAETCPMLRAAPRPAKSAELTGA